MDIADQKKLLRKKFRKLLHVFPENEKNFADQKIYSNLKSLQIYLNASTICFYHSKAEEVDTQKIIKEELKSGKKEIVLPRVSGDHLVLYRISSFSDLETGAYGLLEPKITCQKVSTHKVNLYIIPGLAFSPVGWRLGRGKGFNDRLLGTVKVLKIGLCYDFQILSDIPHEKSDIKMDYIITESKIYTCNY
jgi:5-formyltetrahydrofolate cyclo-ligase